MRTRIVAAALAGGLTLAACGGGSSPSAPDGAGGATVTLPTPAAGPIPDLPVSAEAAAGSPLPEVTVRQINGDGGFVQLKNALPSDRPLLVWFWAPH
jgi:ABC-type glycerol-3-phosphate transport system substrate-binding protein